MAAMLHLVKGDHTEMLLTTIGQQLAAHEAVTVALLHGALPPALPPAVRVLRVPDDLSYAGLLDLIFASDRVVTW